MCMLVLITSFLWIYNDFLCQHNRIMISDDGVWSMIYDLIPNLLFNIISASQAVCIVVRAIAPEKNVWDWILELPVHIEGLSTPAKVTEALQALVFLSLGRVALWKIWGRGSLLVFKSFYDDYPLCVVLKHLMTYEWLDMISLFEKSMIAIKTLNLRRQGWEVGRVAWMEVLKGGTARWEGLRFWRWQLEGRESSGRESGGWSWSGNTNFQF